MSWRTVQSSFDKLGDSTIKFWMMVLACFFQYTTLNKYDTSLHTSHFRPSFYEWTGILLALASLKWTWQAKFCPFRPSTDHFNLYIYLYVNAQIWLSRGFVVAGLLSRVRPKWFPLSKLRNFLMYLYISSILNWSYWVGNLYHSPQKPGLAPWPTFTREWSRTIFYSSEMYKSAFMNKYESSPSWRHLPKKIWESTTPEPIKWRAHSQYRRRRSSMEKVFGGTGHSGFDWAAYVAISIFLLHSPLQE
jgi:hypothetical protein